MSQPPSDLDFKVISTDDGLADASVSSVYQDRHGFIWIGTRNGLNQYSGADMRHIGLEQGMKNVYVYDVIGSYEDSLIWIGTRKGVWVWSRYEETLHPVVLSDGDEPVITQITIESDESVWLAGLSGVWHSSADGWEHYVADSTDNYSLSDNYTTNLIVTSSLVFVGAEKGINVLDRVTGRFSHAGNSKEPLLSQLQLSTQSLYRRSNGELWAGAYDYDKGAVAIQIQWPDKAHFYYNDPKNDASLGYNYSILDFEEDSQGRLWIGTNGGGVSIFEDADSTFSNIVHNPKASDGLNDMDVWETFKDRSGLMWLGTDGGGINLHHSIYDRFFSERHNPFDPHSINSNQILTIEDTDSVVWFGTNSATGLSRMSKHSGKFYNYPFTDNPRVSLYDNTVYDLEQIGQFLWITSYAGGLSRLDIRNGTYEHYYTDESSRDGFLSNYMTTIVPIGETLFLATGAGLASFDMKNKTQHTHINPQYQKQEKLNHLALLGDVLWIATDDGIQLFDVKSEEFLNVPDNYQLSTQVNYIHHSQGFSWLGTHDGLYQISSEGVPRRINGLSNQYIQAITSDDQGRLWVTTKRGLNLLNIKTGQVVKFFEVDGLQDESFNERTIAQGSDGRIYVGGNNGFSWFDPAQVQPILEVVPPQLISAKIITADTFEVVSLIGKDFIDLDHDQSTFMINFFVADYVFPEKLSFKYRLLGLSDQFFDLGNAREISITDLSPGTYQLELYASNVDGVWGTDPIKLHIVVAPPFWLSWYAFLLYVLLIGGVFVARLQYVKAENRRLERLVDERTEELQQQKVKAEKDKELIANQAQQLQELDNVKTRFFSNISHEFRTPLTLIQGPIESVLQGKSKGEDISKNLMVASRNVSTLRNLIDEILDINHLELGKVKLEYIPVDINDYMKELVVGYELMCKEHGITWHHQLGFEKGLKLNLPISKVQKILHNLISNAIKYTGSGKSISLVAKYAGKRLMLSVKDEGSGIPESEIDKIFERFYQTSHGKLMAHSSGIGLAYVKEIAGALGGDVSVQSTIGEGSTFNFSMPAQEFDQPTDVKRKKKETALIEIDLEPYAHPNNKILLAEDNAEMADYICHVLGDQFEINQVQNGQEALDALRHFDADMIITDIMMPVMGGLELMENLKSHHDWKYKSVVMLTAKANQELKLEALNFGIDDYITKPFSPLELEIRVRNILSNQYERNHYIADTQENDTTDPLIEKLIDVIEANIDNSQFGVLNLSESVALSDRQLTRITKKSLGMTPAILIRDVKLQKARNYLEQRKFRSVSEVSYAVGFEKASHFTRLYFERFGKKPSEYLN